jgi:aerobic-type carbon monoxide dehydrogenase small subunit (CoxS/CutS family)
MLIDLAVNGRRQRVDVDPDRTLLSVLREELALTGNKYGCGEGQCGACTVLLGERAVRSCRTPVAKAAATPITTIEGLERGGRMHPLQQAFVEEGAMQCGYCTAGMIMAGVSLLRTTPSPTTDEIVRGMNGNVCRRRRRSDGGHIRTVWGSLWFEHSRAPHFSRTPPLRVHPGRHG